MPPEPKTASALAVAFLEQWEPAGPWLLCAFHPDRKTNAAATFTRDQRPKMRKWIEHHGADKNIYFSVNPTRYPMDKKAGRRDIKELRWLHVDIDPREGEGLDAERARALALLDGHEPHPTCIVFSGGGYQGFWRLSAPMPIEGEEERYKQAARYNMQMEIQFGADPCHNVDRIMRLPGTVNRPDPKKAAKGRVPTLAECTYFGEEVYDLEDFIQAPETTSSTDSATPNVQVASGNLRRLSSIDELGPNVSDLVKAWIVSGPDPNDPEQVNKFPSRSHAMFWLVCEMIRSQVEDDMILAVMLDRDFWISGHIYDQARPEAYALRQIRDGKYHVIDPNLRELNQRHAVIEDLGGKCRIISETEDPLFKRSRITLQSFQDFWNRYSNRKVVIGTNPNTQADITKPLGQWWTQHPLRRTYRTMTFAPGKEVDEGAYNLWRGFSCEARPGTNHEPFLQHIHDNICCGDEEYNTYVLGWLATMFQQPDQPGHTAIVLRGDQGTGKSFFATTVGKLLNQHFLHISDPKHLVGNFNAPLEDTVLILGDECFYAGDKKHESVLKTIITERTIAIEAKGVDMRVCPNYTHLILASNNDWVVPAGVNERRFFVLDVSDGRRQDHGYFGEIQASLDHGGYEHLLYWLLRYDLTGFDVRTVPQTEALRQQKLYSLSPEQEWWYRKLDDGKVLAEHENWEEHVPVELLLDDFVSQLRRWNQARRGNSTRLRMFLASVCPGHLPRKYQAPRGSVLVIDRPDGQETIQRPYYFQLPSLRDARAWWDRHFGGTGSWPEIETEEPPRRSPEQDDLPF